MINRKCNPVAKQLEGKEPLLKKSSLDQCMLFYLYRIAQRLLADYKKTVDKPSPYTEKLKDIRKAYEVLAGALSRLTEKHKIVYLTYHAYEKKGLKLPRTLLKALRDELELTQNSIRVYKKEAKEGIDGEVYGKRLWKGNLLYGMLYILILVLRSVWFREPG